MVHLGYFWLLSCIFFCIDVTTRGKYRIQSISFIESDNVCKTEMEMCKTEMETKTNNSEKQWQSFLGIYVHVILDVMLNHSFLTVALTVIFVEFFIPLFSDMNSFDNVFPFSTWRDVLYFLVYTALNAVVGDIWFYCWHRFVHRFLYRFHKKHHEITNPFAFATFYFHPLDSFFTNCFSIIFCFFIGCFNVYHFFIFLVIGTHAAIIDHSGCSLFFFFS